MGFKKENVVLLTDRSERKPTLRNTRLSLSPFLVRSAKKDDTVVIFWAGHTRVFKRVLKAAELPNFRLYDLRHTFASLLLAKNAPITYVAAQLGHAKPTTTLQWYAHWLPTNRRTYVDALDAEETLSEAVAEIVEATPRRSVPARHGTDWAPFRQTSKDPELEMWKKGGSPGWARTSDILINSECPEQPQQDQDKLRPRDPEN
jgi:hypothetical protein